MGDFKQALSVYKSAVQKWPDDKAISAEAEAKKNYYNHTYRPAVKAYNAWLLAEPQQPEALFDLAQLYAQYGKWNNGLNTYNSLLSQIPAHRQAALAKQKIDFAASRMFVRSGVEYFSAETKFIDATNHRQADTKSTSIYSSLTYPINERVSAFVNLDSKSYDFRIANPNTPKNPVTYGLMAGAEYRNMPNIALSAGLGMRMNPGDVDNGLTGFINANSQPVDNLHVGVTLRNDDIVTNTSSFTNQLEATRLQGRVAYNGYRRWQAGMDIAFDSYADNQSYDNSSLTVGADVVAHLLYEPQRLSVSYRLQEYGFDKNHANHPQYYNYLWTPKSYTTHTFGLEWQHYLNRERFHGSNNTYYDIAFRVGLEQEGDISRQIHASINHDWNSRLATSLEGQYTWGTSAEIYQDSMVKAEFRWFL
jgi:tetratricopeptide (TPR) repeat protein